MNELFLSLDPVITGGALVLVLLVVASGIAVYQHNFGPRARLQRRIEMVAGPSGMSDRKDDKPGGGLRKKAIQGKLKEIEEQRLKKNKDGGIKEMLFQSGLTITFEKYVIFSVVFAVICAFLSFVSGMSLITTGLVTSAAGLWFPRYYLRRKVTRRLAKFTANFATAIDVIVRGIRTGLPVGECLVMIGREMEDPVGLEFRLITEGQRIGMSLDDVMTRLVERVPTSEAKFFAIVLLIQKQTGGNLAETLDKLSAVLRGRKKMKDKIQSMSSEAKASAGIIGALPFAVGTVLYLANPDYMSPLFTMKEGHVMLIAAGCVMTIGILIMKKMINFKF